MRLSSPSVTSVYTCPMHPKIRQPGPGSCPKCGMALEKIPARPLSSETESVYPMHSQIERIRL